MRLASSISALSIIQWDSRVKNVKTKKHAMVLVCANMAEIEKHILLDTRKQILRRYWLNIWQTLKVGYSVLD